MLNCFRSLAAGAIGLCLLAVPSMAQQGLLTPGQVMGNAGASNAVPRGAALTSMVGRSCTTAGGWIVSLGSGSAQCSTVDGSAATLAGTLTFTGTPTYTGVGVGISMPLNSATQTVAAGKIFNFIRLTQTSGSNTVFTIGASSTVAGVYSDLTMALGSNSTAAAYGGVLHATNAGPGTTRGAHLGGFALAGSTGVIAAAAAQIEPVATSTGAWGIYASLTSSGVDDKAIAYGIETSGDRYAIGVGSTIAPVGIGTAFYRAWMATGSSANARAFQILNNAGGEIAYWHKDGSLNAISLTLTTTPLVATSGGTGFASYAVGDLLYASTTTALSKLADIATGNALLSGGVGVAPAWGKIDLAAHVTGSLPSANGGTGLSSYAIGDLIYASATTPTLSKLAAVATGNVLVSQGTNTAPAWSAAPSLTTSLTVPLYIGGSGTTGTQLTLKTTTGNGTTDALAIVGGNNGGTSFATFASAATTLPRPVSITNSTASSSTSTGALIVSGGIGFAGAMYGGNTVAFNTTSLPFAGTSDYGMMGLGGAIGGIISFVSGSSEIGRFQGTTALYFLVAGVNFYIGTTGGGYMMNVYNNGGVFIGNNASAADPGNGNLTLAGTTAASSNTTGTLQVSGGAGFAKDVYLATGTTAIAPLTFTSGTNLTTARAGGLEFDGTSFYATSVASTRQVIATEQLCALTADYTLTDSATAQKSFNCSTNGAVTLPASTSYFFEAVYFITNTGATSHTWATLFAGTATVTELQYSAQAYTGITSAATLTALSANYQTTSAASLPSTALVITAASTSSTENITIVLRGIIRVNGAGTVIPQVKLSAQPNGTEKMLKGSYIRLWPVGTNSVATVGNWSFLLDPTNDNMPVGINKAA